MKQFLVVFDDGSEITVAAHDETEARHTAMMSLSTGDMQSVAASCRIVDLGEIVAVKHRAIESETGKAE